MYSQAQFYYIKIVISSSHANAQNEHSDNKNMEDINIQIIVFKHISSSYEIKMNYRISKH
jgi:hypothetical protein